MKKLFTVKRICRAGIIAALYVALTYAFGAISFNGILQIRPAEALCILPLFFPEAVPALFVGCILSNFASPFIIYDVPIGSAATLIAALGTYFAGRLIKKDIVRFIVGGLFPVLVNAFVIPVIIVFLCGDLCGYNVAGIAYWVNFGSLCATEGLWVYALGGILYFTIAAMRKKGVSVFIDEDEKQKPEQEEAQV
ncbi:MAG: QueT transporter family protein [Clostridiales bacterium]|nr:QueT transporter family protein [Clostridiales bacterium]